MKFGRYTPVLIVLITLALAGTAIYLGIKLGSGETAVDQSNAASQQVWNAEIFNVANIGDYYPDKTLQEAMLEFEQAWKTTENAPDFDFEKGKEFALGKGGRFVQNLPVVTVGDETLYGRDLNYFLYVYKYREFTVGSPISETALNVALDHMIEQSLILQQAKKNGLLTTLDADIFNSKEKNLTKRNELVNTELDSIKDTLVEKFSYEVVTLYYDNVQVNPANPDGMISSRDSSLTKEGAKKLAQDIMTKTWGELDDGTLKFSNILETFRNNSNVEKLDENYQQNTYASVVDVSKANTYFVSDLDSGVDMTLTQELWSLGEGQMSKVLQSEDDTRFVIIKLNKRTSTDGADSVDQFIENSIEQTDINVKVAH